MQIPKSKQLAYRKKRKNPKVDINEDALQKQANDLLDWMHIGYYRIPDFVWLWLKNNAPIEVLRALSDCFAGKLPDNFCFEKLTDKYLIALPLELKTKTGRLHGKQKKYARDYNWQISRSPDETIEIVNQFKADAELYTKYLKEVEFWNNVGNAGKNKPQKTEQPTTNSEED